MPSNSLEEVEQAGELSSKAGSLVGGQMVGVQVQRVLSLEVLGALH